MSRRRGPLFAGIGLALVVVIALVAMWIAGGRSDAGEHARSPLSTAEGGARATAEVLRQQGVEVVVVHSFAEAEAATRGRDATLLIDDDWWLLTDEAYARVGALSDSILVVQPTDTALEVLAPWAEYAGFGGGESAAACDLPAAERAERIDTAGDGIAAPSSAIRCFPTGGGGYALVRMQTSDATVTLLGAGAVLQNDEATRLGHAALALGLLGERETLVWYQPDVDDLAFESDDSLARFQADWYLPFVVLLLLTGLAAIIWRGRRMGPVVVEDLPVEVRASETMEGRARLYERAGARDHAIGALRTATITRLARMLGLPRTASDDEIIAAAASVTSRDPGGVAALVRAAPAPDDRALMRLSDELLTLERDVARGVTPR